VGGHIMQVAKAFKASSVFQTASAVISKFKFW
jgi:hypothetical protein